MIVVDAAIAMLTKSAAEFADHHYSGVSSIRAQLLGITVKAIHCYGDVEL